MDKSNKIRNIYICGAKGFTYGGYETFLDKLTLMHRNKEGIRYHIACKANGKGITDEKKLDGVSIISENEYSYHNAHCFKIKSPDIGTAQAILYDIKALKYVLRHIKENNIEKPIVYVLSSRIGFTMGFFAKRIHKLGGVYWHNPDGLEFKRRKYPAPVRAYWKLSETKMVKHADLEICDSKNIEKYIKEEYKKYSPATTYIAYGSELTASSLPDDAPAFMEWLDKWGLKAGEYYLSVGRFVPENNFETMISEYMKSGTDKPFAIITTRDDKFLKKLDEKLRFSANPRIRFVGTVYDRELLKKIRENAYAYFHGHEVGGTNPSLLEALSSTSLNIVYDVCYNREVAEDAALYWTKDENSLKGTIDKAEALSEEERKSFGLRAKQRISDAYSWEHIAGMYEEIIVGS